MPEKITIKSPAKINLFLDVLDVREDGFHNILSLFHPVNLADKIILKPTKKETFITSSNKEVPTCKENLIFQAIDLFGSVVEIPNFEIHLEKNIPMGAGLGGGSSNAGVVLKELNDFYQNPLDDTQLFDMAMELGSDVGFFLNCKTSIVKGRGEVIEPLQDEIGRLDILIVHPKAHCHTGRLYCLLDDIPNRQHPEIKPILEALKQGNTSVIGGNLFNAFESAAFDLYPDLLKIKEILIQEGFSGALLTGSGSNLFALGKSREDIEGRLSKIINKHPQFPSCTITDSL